MGGKHYKLLIVDDEHIVRYGITHMIPWEDYDITISQASNGQEALQLIEKEHPDFILTDIRMPGIDGLELIEEIDALKVDIIVAILSGYNDFEYARKAMKYGVRHYLLKPAEESEILEVVEKMVEDKKVLENKRKVLEHIDVKVLDCCENASDNPIINEVIEQIKNHISNEKLSLNWLAKEVLYRNPDYIGKLFRQVMDTSFSDYCVELRINKAKVLLLTSHRLKKICRVAEEVGFGNNPRYFSQVFKKKTGYTPNDFKKMNQ